MKSINIFRDNSGSKAKQESLEISACVEKDSNRFLKVNYKPQGDISYPEDSLAMSSGKWLSQTSNDSAFYSTGKGCLCSSGQLDDDSIRDEHQLSNLSLDHDAQSLTDNPEDKVEENFAFDFSKSNEELSKRRTSTDNESCTSLPTNISSSALSIFHPTPSKRASLDNMADAPTSRRQFGRSTSFEDDFETEPLSFKQKFKIWSKMPRRSNQLTKEQNIPNSDISPTSSLVSVLQLEQFDLWAPKCFLSTKDCEFQIKPASPSTKLKLVDPCTLAKYSHDSKVAIIYTAKNELGEPADVVYQKCLFKGKVFMQNKLKHMFLFESSLLIARQRLQTTFRLKENINLTCLWLANENQQSNDVTSIQDSITLGWSQKQINNVNVKFFSLHDKLSWVNAITRERDKMNEPLGTKIVIKVHFEDKKNENRTKKISVNMKESASDVITRVPKEFFPTTGKELEFQFCLKFVGDSEKYILSGCECLYTIQMASDNKLLEKEVEYFSIVPIKSSSFVRRSVSWKRTSKMISSGIYPDLVKSKSADQAEKKIFERPLHDVCGDHGGELPKVVLELLEFLYTNGPFSDGVFRKCSNYRELQTAVDLMDQQKLPNMTVNVACSLLKIWLGKMPDCLLLGDNYFKWLEIAEIEISNRRACEIKTLVDQLPEVNHLLLRYIICVLHKIAHSSEINKMPSHNLAVCIGPSILRPSASVSLETEADSRERVNVIVKALIDHAEEIFGKEHCLDLFLKKEENDPIKSLSQPPTSPENENFVLSLPECCTVVSQELSDRPLKSVKKTISPDSGISQWHDETDPDSSNNTQHEFEVHEISENESVEHKKDADSQKETDLQTIDDCDDPTTLSEEFGFRLVSSPDVTKKKLVSKHMSFNKDLKPDSLPRHRSFSAQRQFLQPFTLEKITQQDGLSQSLDGLAQKHEVSSARCLNPCYLTKGKPRHIACVNIEPPTYERFPVGPRRNLPNIILPPSIVHCSPVPKVIRNGRSTSRTTIIHIGLNDTSVIEEPPRPAKNEIHRKELSSPHPYKLTTTFFSSASRPICLDI